MKNKILLLIVPWILLTLYPNPLLIGVNIYRICDMPIDSNAVKEISDSLSESPQLVYEWVEKNIQYDYDWRVYRVPWYLPNPKEILSKGKGDCKSKAIIFASILEEKGISYELKMSSVHVWINYEGKQMGEFEKKYESDRKIPFQECMHIWHDGFWIPMPFSRKIILFSGIIGITLVAKFWKWKKEKQK